MNDNDEDDLPDGEGVIYLSVEQVLVLHEEGIRTYTPDESFHILSRDALEAAVMSPRQTFGGEDLYPSLIDKAAAYLVGLAQNHAFQNGNKRVAFAAMSVFLRMNGFRLTLSQEEAIALTMGVVTRTIDREEAVQVLENAITSLV